MKLSSSYFKESTCTRKLSEESYVDLVAVMFYNVITVCMIIHTENCYGNANKTSCAQESVYCGDMVIKPIVTHMCVIKATK